MSGTLTVQVTYIGGYAVVTPAGQLDIATADQLRQRLAELLAEPRAVVVDLDRLSFVGAAGLGVLVGAANRARDVGGSLQLVCTQTQTRRLFVVTGLTRRLYLHRGLQEILAEPAPPTHRLTEGR